MPNQSETVDWREGCRLTGLSKSNWYKQLRDRTIPAARIGTRVVVRRSVLLDFLQNQEAQTIQHAA